MTNTEFINYKILLEQSYVDFVYNMIQSIRGGANVIPCFKKLILVNTFIDQILDCELSEEGTNINYYTPTQLIDINFYIGKVLEVVYNPDFILTN